MRRVIADEVGAAARDRLAPIARVFLEGDDAPSDEDTKRESARLRKRFQLVKERLLTMGRERGLLRR